MPAHVLNSTATIYAILLLCRVHKCEWFEVKFHTL